MKAYFQKTGEVLPMKGYVLDQGSNPTHKGIIISLYEQAISPPDIVLKTGHTQTAVDRYIKTYEQVFQLVKKQHEHRQTVSAFGQRFSSGATRCSAG